MKKLNSLWGWLMLFAGVLLFCIHELWRLHGGLLPGMSGSLIGFGAAILLRNWYWGREEKAHEYAKKVKAEAIAQQDERNIMLRDRSCYLVFQAFLILLCLLTLAFQVLDTLGIWQPWAIWAGFFCFGLLLLMVLLYEVIFRILNKRM